ncbi:TPA: hypothetical protein PXO57_000389 [Yersinia enterocolitica]|uniref:hypothetical protein n=1 Tax=Yersinia kristensenii TaxID=28152 RepID=UPI0011A6AF29|nr:hypothetical protein [Yersinia kristensenii]HDL6593720.1 hypothetical protein [Yersinia enterocolitica]HDL7590019.1 hypothetical protein [Yersinia enterocolitica]
MELDILRRFCTDVREALENACSERINNEITSLHQCAFPKGCCGDASDILAYLIFKEFRVLSLRRSGVYMDYLISDVRLKDKNNHAWIVLDGIIIDLTADQFNNQGFNNPKVMITQNEDFHRLFASRDERYNKDTPDCPRIKPQLMATTNYICKFLNTKGWSLN